MLNSFLAEEWLSRNDARRHSNKTVGSFQTVRSTRLSLVLYEFLFHSENFFRLELTDCEDDYSSLMTMHDESTTTLLFAFSCSSPSFTYTHTFLLFLTTSPSFLTLLPLLFLDILLSINSFLQPLPCPTYLPPTNAIPIPYSHIHPFLTIPIYMYISSISSIFTSRIRCGTRWKLRKNRNDWCALWNWRNKYKEKLLCVSVWDCQWRQSQAETLSFTHRLTFVFYCFAIRNIDNT